MISIIYTKKKKKKLRYSHVRKEICNQEGWVLFITSMAYPAQTSLVHQYDIRNLQSRSLPFPTRLKENPDWMFLPSHRKLTWNTSRPEDFENFSLSPAVCDLLKFTRHRMSLCVKYGSLLPFSWNKRHLDKWIIWFQCLFWTNPPISSAEIT